MKTKGFTLIELLVVIMIMGIILTLAIPNVSNLIHHSGKDTYSVQMKILKEATDLYISQNREKLLGIDNSCIKISYETIKVAEKMKENITCNGDIYLKKTVTNSFTKQYDLSCKDKNEMEYKNDGVVPTGCTIYPIE